ncbi:lipid droplet-associated protein [Actinokineospora guangxiensis]|uniref:Lipid droplet-associated protein n=1 Tax=Actinokineospora guangxiensis TaxID=1490288 RepID=A0ABW0EM70_9PSEU
MKSLPLPLRVAAGLAVTAVERARDLPSTLAGLPVTVVSQALQASMRLQQQVTELAIRGDEALAALLPVEESPEWATFDEDIDVEGDLGGDPAPSDPRASAFDRADDEPDLGEDDAEDPWSAEERAIAGTPVEPPTSVANYDELSLPQLRARLRAFTVAELEELLAYERGTENRPSFVGMLTRRIATVRDQT